jgi:hypothetical protein
MSILSNRLIPAVAFSLMCVAGTAVQAQQTKGTNRGPAAATTDSARAVDSAQTATALVRFGDANKDPLALITAARILKSIGSSESTAKRTGGTPGDDKGKPAADTVESILARAKTLAAGRADLIALADDVEKSGSRGATGGPKRNTTVVASRGTDRYSISFDGGRPARVFVSGDGDSDLDLYVYDQNGNLICKDDDNSDDMICGWTPSWTGPFTIRVVNRGILNRYVLWTN